MPRSPGDPILVKAKSDISPARSVKFDLPPRNTSSTSNMSGKSPPAGRAGRSPTRRSSNSADSPRAGGTSGSRKPSSSASPPRSMPGSPGKGSKHISPPARGRKGSRERTGSGSKKSQSPPKSAGSKKGGGQTGGGASTASGKGSKAGSAKAKEDKKKPKTPDMTASGLKIVDWTGQGMTTLPSNLISAKDIGHLILASNNLRSIPPEIKRMKTLEKLDLSKNGIRCSSCNDFSGLPQEMALLTNLTEFSISECNLPHVPPAIFRMTSLRVLDLSRNKVNILLPEIGQLTQLVKLNLQQTNITSLPPELAYCQELQEIYLWGNSVETLPETLPEMPNLRVLALNYRSFCGVVDPYMENLLKKGQIKSEHIPMVVFELPALQVLDLESTKLNTLPEIYNIQLREFYLCKNFLQTIPPSIYSLKYLRVLDMSRNLLSTLPEDIGRLKGLKVLRLSGNSFERVPPTIGHLAHLTELDMSRNRIRRLPPEIKGLTALEVLLLESNCIQSLPEEVCDLTQLHTLDLTDNQIRSLPMAMYRLTRLTEAHSFKKLEKCGLWLYKNPLEQPSPEVWRTERPDNIFEYLKKLLIIKTENLQRQKIQVIGDSQSGKTSLIRALSLRKSMLTYGYSERTRLLQQTMWKTENNVEFVLNDFGGDNTYRLLYKMFLDPKGLVMLVYNAATFCKENFYNSIGQWLDMLAASTPGIVVKIVGTQVDRLQPEEEEEDEDEIKTIASAEQELKILYPASEDSTHNLAEGEEEEEDDLFEVGGNSEDLGVVRNTSTPAVPEPSHSEIVQEMVAQHLNEKETKVRDELQLLKVEIFKMTSAKSGGQGSDVELTDMEEAALKMLRVREQKLTEILEHPIKVLPEVSSVSASDSLQGILPLIDELEHLAIDQTLFPHAQRLIPGHWNRLRAMLKQRKGYYLYWDDIEQTAQLFSIKGEELCECIKYLEDTADVFWFYDYPGLADLVFHKPRVLIDIIASLFRHDIRQFLQYDTNKVFTCKGKLSEEQFQEASDLFLHTGEVSRPLVNCLLFDQGFNNDDLTMLLELLPMMEICYTVPEPDAPDGPFHSRALLVIPWYNRDLDLEPLRDVWPARPAGKERELAVIYTLPFYNPPELLPNISAQIQDFVEERMDWQNHIYASCETEKMLLQQTPEPGGGALLTVMVRGADFAEVQDLMEEMVDLVNTQLNSYPGLYWKLTIPMGGATLKLANKGVAGGRRASRLSRSLSFKN
ncbi:malignant fibrous histiocytoma-amplified sequence 1-like protein [Plakobranchus ocellatus]|uniref:Malignant fibrous histiocytoma-amplified sequence 1-like protein n=1 Tax=Plakobranchus ocellatus TaxID=259542 RepID=A0AAV4AML6_9GAST|nr:malignant fibrous histiocytoma-amplified sequence 1-like protein [Plakobranchus ocellatus]